MKVGYARVSREEQHLELQLDALKAAGCEQIFTEKIKSVKDLRPQLEQALKYVRPGDTLVVWRLDRLGRSLKNLLEIMGFLEERGIEFQSLTEHLDTSNPSGKLIFHIFASVAEFERALTKDAHAQALPLLGLVAGKAVDHAEKHLTPHRRSPPLKCFTIKEHQLRRSASCSIAAHRLSTVILRRRRRIRGKQGGSWF